MQSLSTESVFIENKNIARCQNVLPPDYVQFHHSSVAECLVTLLLAPSHPALDSGARHPHTVIIPKLMSLLSVELLKRCVGHWIPRKRETALFAWPWAESKMDTVVQKKTPADETVSSSDVGQVKVKVTASVCSAPNNQSFPGMFTLGSYFAKRHRAKDVYNSPP